MVPEWLTEVPPVSYTRATHCQEGITLMTAWDFQGEMANQRRILELFPPPPFTLLTKGDGPAGFDWSYQTGDRSSTHFLYARHAQPVLHHVDEGLDSPGRNIKPTEDPRVISSAPFHPSDEG